MLPVFGAAAVLVFAAGPASAQKLDQAVAARSQGTDASARSQGRIDTLSDDTDVLLDRYRIELDQINSLRVYNGQLQDLITSQENEMASLREQIENVTIIGRQVTPLMLRMVESIAAFVQLDVPFLPEERAARVAQVRDLMTRADVTDAEKYRRILEAYQIENDYGRTLGTYRGELTTDGETRTVDFLRLGRVALMYQTLDEREAGVWDHKKQEWVILSSEYRPSIRKGLRMARKQSAPDLLRLPVPAPEDAL